MTTELYNRIVAAAPELKHELDMELAKADLDAARADFDDVCDRYSDDVTGQDGENEKDEAARNWCNAQDHYIRSTDPERWAEMRMGA